MRNVELSFFSGALSPRKLILSRFALVVGGFFLSLQIRTSHQRRETFAFVLIRSASARTFWRWKWNSAATAIATFPQLVRNDDRRKLNHYRRALIRYTDYRKERRAPSTVFVLHFRWAWYSLFNDLLLWWLSFCERPFLVQVYVYYVLMGKNDFWRRARSPTRTAFHLVPETFQFSLMNSIWTSRSGGGLAQNRYNKKS